MPIRPEFRHFYNTPEWKETRERILQRARHRCEDCRAPNHTRVARACGWWVVPPPLFWCQKFPQMPPQLRWTDPYGKTHGPAGFPVEICREVYIVLTISHLDHTPGHDTDDKLRARCQWCHLTYDQRFHKQTRSIRKDAARPLLQEITC